MTTATTKINKEGWFDSFSYMVHTPDATLFVVITDNHNGEPMMVSIHGVKNNIPLMFWIKALENFINNLLSTGVHVNKIITLLDVPASPKYSQNANGVRIYSGPDGVKWVLTQYLQEKTINKDKRIVLNVGSRLG